VPGAGFAALVLAFADDPAQRLFAGVVVLVLLVIAASDLIFAPRLTVDEDGLRVYAPFDRVRLPWRDIDSVTVSTVRRLGLRSAILEISAGDRLVVLDRHDLAADPWAVTNRIAELLRSRNAA
jgi:hypothetical protein